MSKAAKISIGLLIFLLLCTLGYTFFELTEKKKLGDEKYRVENDLQQVEGQLMKSKKEISGVTQKLQETEGELSKRLAEIRSLKKEIDQVSSAKRKLSDKVAGLEKKSIFV